MLNRRWPVAFVCLVCALVVHTVAQEAAFEVASVKPADSEELRKRNTGFLCGFRPGGTFLAFGSLRWLITCAYGLRAARAGQEIVNEPKWIDDLFDITAKIASDEAVRSQSMAPLRTLLADRFKLVVHRETRDVPTYALVVARRDGKLGPQVHPTGQDCLAWLAGGRRGTPPPAPGDLPCGRQMGGSATAIQATAMTMSQLATLLSPRAERPVQDRTGLAGSFNLDLRWQSDRGPADPALADRLPTSLFTALEEQLGLKLEPTKGSIEVLVIDHVEKPTPD